jgi:hypothetical protein
MIDSSKEGTAMKNVLQEGYKFTIDREQHVERSFKFLESPSVISRELESKITRAEAEEIMKDFSAKDYLLQVLPTIKEGETTLKDFLEQVKEICYVKQSLADYHRTLPNITIKGQKTPVVQKRVLFDGQGKKIIDFNDPKKKFVATESVSEEDKQNLIPLEKFIQLFTDRGVNHAEFIVNLFNQSTLNGMIAFTAFELMPLGLKGLPWNLNNIENIELSLNDKGEVIGFNVMQKMILLEHFLKSLNVQDNTKKIQEDHAVYCTTEISIDPSKSQYLFGACKIQSLQTTFSSKGKLGGRLLKDMEYQLKLEQKIDYKKIQELLPEEYIESMRRKFFDGEIESLMKTIIQKADAEEKKIKQQAKDLKIDNDDKKELSAEDIKALKKKIALMEQGIRYGIAQDNMVTILSEKEGITRLEKEIKVRKLRENLTKLGSKIDENGKLISDEAILRDNIEKRKLILKAAQYGFAEEKIEKLIQNGKVEDLKEVFSQQEKQDKGNRFIDKIIYYFQRIGLVIKEIFFFSVDKKKSIDYVYQEKVNALLAPIELKERELQDNSLPQGPNEPLSRNQGEIQGRWE